jgi:hypothetical protein
VWIESFSFDALFQHLSLEDLRQIQASDDEIQLVIQRESQMRATAS